MPMWLGGASLDDAGQCAAAIFSLERSGDGRVECDRARLHVNRGDYAVPHKVMGAGVPIETLGREGAGKVGHAHGSDPIERAGPAHDDAVADLKTAD